MERELCEYCGKELEPIILPSLLGKTDVKVGWKQCNCDGALNAEAEIIAKEAERELARRSQRLIDKVSESRIPKRYREARLNDESLYEAAFKDGLYLYGSVGTGKTTTAAAIGIRALQSGKKVLFVKAYEVSELSKDELRKVENADLLIVDDLGAENTSEWNNTRLRMVIDRRYDSMLPVVITSNYSKDQLKKLLLRNVKDMTPKAIVSRLTEMTKEVKIDGEDMRK